MTATTEHRPAEAHHHTHGPDCGHLAVIHGDHVDYIHNGHYDECDTCSCEHCSDPCAVCTCEDCSCPTCTHAA